MGLRTSIPNTVLADGAGPGITPENTCRLGLLTLPAPPITLFHSLGLAGVLTLSAGSTDTKLSLHACLFYTVKLRLDFTFWELVFWELVCSSSPVGECAPSSLPGLEGLPPGFSPGQHTQEELSLTLTQLLPLLSHLPEPRTVLCGA